MCSLEVYYNINQVRISVFVNLNWVAATHFAAVFLPLFVKVFPSDLSDAFFRITVLIMDWNYFLFNIH